MEISKLDKDISFEDFLEEYKIQGVGPKLSKDISKKLVNVATLRNLLEENKLEEVLLEIDGLGKNISKNIANTLMDVDFFLTLEDMEDSGFNMFKDEKIYELSEISSKIKPVPKITLDDIESIGSLKGLNIVITGTLSMPRKFFETAIYKLGGHVLTSITSNVDILIYGTKDGTDTTKYKNTLKFNSTHTKNIKLLTEADFNVLVKSLS